MKPIYEFLTELRTMNVRLWVNDGQLHYKANRGVLTTEWLAQMKARKAEIITFLREANRETSAGVPPIRSIGRDRDIPLSFAQQRLWFLYQFEGKSATYNIPAARRIVGPLDMVVLQRSLDGVVRRHEILRTTFAVKDGQAVQVIVPNLTISPTVIDLRDLPEKEKSANVRQLIRRESHFCFDLMNDLLLRITLLRLNEEEHVLILVMHHIISDGWSLEIFVRELTAFVKAFSTGVSVSLPELSIQYADFAYWQREWLREEVLETQLEYWKRQLEGAPLLLELPTDRARPALQTYRGGVKYFRIKPELTGRLKALSQQSDVSLFMTLFAAFVALLFRYSGQKDFVVGTHTAGRERIEIEPLIGFFINTLALRVDLSENPSFQELLAQVRQIALDGFSHQDIPFEKLVEALQPERNMSHAPLVQVAFVLQNMPIGKPEIPDVSITPIEMERLTAKFDLSLLIEESEQGLQGEMEYNSDLFDAATIIRMVGHFLTMLEGIVTNPRLRISELPLLSKPELRQMLVEWNDTKIRPVGRCIHQVFESWVERIPEETAVVADKELMTYRQLNTKANQLAHHLKALGVESDIPVGVCVERSIEMIVGILGILKAGGAYVPLDPDYPHERMAIILADSQARVVLTQKELSDKIFQNHHSQLPKPIIICLDTTQWEEISRSLEIVNPEIEVNTGNLAYIIYTSGSTGTPKGVMIEQHSVLNLVSALEETIYGNSKGPLRFSLLASIVFDASVQQIFASLLGGHTLYIVDAQTRRDGVQLCQFFKNNGIEVADCTPSSLSMMVDAGLPRMEGLVLKHLIVGGEALPTTLITDFYPHNTEQNIAITNVYGPTECCVDATAFTLKTQQYLPQNTIIPIGKPLANIQVFILDEYGNPVPVGVHGELCIAGTGVGRGYLNRPELTEEKFIDLDSWIRTLGVEIEKIRDRSPQKLYRTGDIVRYLADGNIEFIGRNDDQVKIRGYRIELGDIESHLRVHPKIQKAAVVAKETAENYRELVAYLVLELEKEITVLSLRDYLREKLPEYMVPAHFIILEALPINASGKIDRKALPAPDAALTLDQGVEYVAPRDEREQALALIWESVLKLKRVGIRENYFSLGGDSIKALQISARLHEKNMKLEMRALFLHPTIEELAPHLTNMIPAKVTETDLTGEVPLTAIQKWFFQDYKGAKHHFNQAILLKAEKRLEENALRITLAGISQHHSTLRMHYPLLNNGDYVQEYGDKFPGFECVNIRNVADPVAALTRHATQVQNSINLEDGPLIKAVLYQLPENDRLFIVVHHLVIDGVSWRIILEDIQTAYKQAKMGLPLQLPPVTHSFKEWAKRIQLFADAEVLTEKAFWEDIENVQIPSLPTDFVVTDGITHGECGICSIKLSSQQTEELLKNVNHAYNTEINDILLTALARAMQRWHGKPITAIMLEGHGREPLFEDINISRTVGWFTSMYPVILALSGSKELGHQIKTVKETLRLIPRKGVGYGIIKYLTSPAHKIELNFRPLISFNYLGQFGGRETDFELFSMANEDVGPMVNQNALQPYLLEVIGMIFTDCLELKMGYSQKHFREETARTLLTIYKEELITLINHAKEKKETELTPADIDYDGFDLGQLDTFINNL